MFKAVTNLREQKGFTLIELLIVIAIIGILAAIAVPAFLGQREKAKVKQIEASAKGSVAEIQAALDSMVMQEPIIALNTAGQEQCYEFDDPPSGKDCTSMYSGITRVDDGYTDVEDVIDIITAHHLGKGEKSIYGTGNLFVETDGQQGTVYLANTTGRSIRIRAYAGDTTNFIFNTIVTAR